MNLYCLHEGYYEGVQSRLDHLEKACEVLDIAFISLNSLTVDYSILPTLAKDDMLYNSSRGSQVLESLLLNKEVTTFYINNPELNQTTTTTDWGIIHDKSNLPSPKTIYQITKDRQLLKRYIDFLGGFPIIIKVSGGSCGIGTIKIDGWQNLISTVDYLMTTKDKFIFRQFITAKSGCRMIVLGKEVIAAADFAMNENDFRNAALLSQVKYFSRAYPQIVKEIALKATELANLNFSGADFLEDENGNYYLLEVNFPTGFAGLIDVCGVDIPLKMIQYLKNKALKK